jgi:hypothetical protein
MSVCQMWAVCILLAAAGDPDAKGAAEDIRNAPHWEIAPEISSFRYEEPGMMKNQGILYGVAGAYTSYHANRLFRIEGEFALGTVDYEGSLTDGTPYTMEGSHDYLLKLQALWGRRWETEGWDHQFYGGLGYRGLKDDSTQDPAGYDRRSTYLYVPLGLKTYHELAERWQIGLGGEFDLLLLGLQYSKIWNDGGVTNLQWPGIGARVSVELRHRAPSVDLAIAPFLQYWWVDDSAASHDWYEPRNHSLQYGLSLIWRF